MHAALDSAPLSTAAQPLVDRHGAPYLADLSDTDLPGLGLRAIDIEHQLQAGRTFVDIAHALGTTAQDLTIALRAAIVHPRPVSPPSAQTAP